ncbi:MAG: hypothetical protein IJH12_03780 [Clostridia bacterium]|nr:hypothetical protein [Clostridia bacterium]
MAREKFVRKHCTDEETKELFKKIADTRPKTACQAEKVAIAMYKELARKLEAESKRKD